MPSLTLSRLLAASVEDSWRIVVEIERFPEFMDNVTSVQILRTVGNRKMIAWEMMIDDAPLDWTEEVSYDDARFRVEFRAIDGIFEHFDGYWQVHPRKGGSLINVQLKFEIGLPEIADIISPILKNRLKANLESMLARIEARAALQ